MRSPAPLTLLLLATCACDCSDPSTREPEDPTTTAETPPAEDDPAKDRLAMLAAADRRVLSEALRDGARSGDVETRRVASLAVARLHDPAAVPVLEHALADPDPVVRRRASLGLGALEDRAPDDASAALLGALAAETVTANRAAMLTDLGRIGGEDAVGAFREALAGNEPEARAAACTGLGSYGLRSRSVDPAILRRVAARMVDDTTPEVRLACSYALTRLSPPPPTASDDARAIVEDLGRASADDDAEVRAMAVRGLGRYPGAPVDLLAARAADPDWRVAVQAFRSLAKVEPSPDAAYARALRSALDRVVGPSGAMTGPDLQVLLAAFDAAGAMARSSAIHGVAAEALDRIARRPGAPDRDRGLAHCAAAALVDRGRGWPTRLTDCGLGQVSDEERRVRMAEVAGSLEGALPQRLALVERLFREGDTRAKQAVLAALPALDPSSVGSLVIAGLGSGDSGVITSAADAAVALAPKWREPATEQPVLSVRPAGAPMPVAEPARTGPSQADLDRALRRAWDHLSAEDDVEGIQSWAKAVAALGSGRFGEQLASLVRHPAQPVRAAAMASLRDLGMEVPAEAPGPVSNPIAPSDIPSGAPLRAVLETERGEIEIELATADAPTTVARFTELARAGFYDGLTFHRVVPAFVIQGGDPRGDGYGGPGWTQRCEDNRLPYRRGTVGMALAGRDTGGSQFFIAHSAQPHLEGRYTAFGRVLRGMNVVDAIQPGDTIRRVVISQDDAE